jgi:hypothetical protein
MQSGKKPSRKWRGTPRIISGEFRVATGASAFLAGSARAAPGTFRPKTGEFRKLPGTFRAVCGQCFSVAGTLFFLPLLLAAIVSTALLHVHKSVCSDSG